MNVDQEKMKEVVNKEKLLGSQSTIEFSLRVGGHNQAIKTPTIIFPLKEENEVSSKQTKVNNDSGLLELQSRSNRCQINFFEIT